MNKIVQAITVHYPYVSEAEANSMWKWAKSVATKKRVRGALFYGVAAKIANNRAKKLNAERLAKDEREWREQKRAQHDGDW